MKLLAEGAEASIYVDKDRILKRRHRKGYRIKELDEKLRIFRTKREAKIYEKIKKLDISVPKLISVDETSLEMEFIKGDKLRNVLSRGNCGKIGEKIGKIIGEMHNNNIIHGDLTTSNMILKAETHFIDFGLGFFSDKKEDKAVDLHLLSQALNSSHSNIAQKTFKAVIKGYKKINSRSSDILKRLEIVEARGKYKGKKK